MPRIVGTSRHREYNNRTLNVDPTRFRLAARIHFALLRQYGEDVEIAALLKGSREAREALWVCEACGDAELVELAAQFKRASPKPASTPALAAKPADAPQDAAWASNTTGFGVSIPSELTLPRQSDAAPRTLLNPSSWLRRSTTAR
ncbi:MAG TPA: hypothetical protein VJO99_15295 [Burkholderiaceae bacterium]|nr:hypothetical protein [Burkholderiaceae bacterium]